MNKVIKFGLLSLLIIFVLIVGAVGYFMATFNPNAYKPQIIQAVKDKQQRTLKLDGDIKLTIFPSIGAKVSKVSLSEFRSSKEFASIENARVSLALMPLLSRQVVVNNVDLSGIKVNVVKLKDGSSNLDDLIGKQESKKALPAATPHTVSPVKFDIAGVNIVNTEFSYRDERTGAQYFLKRLNLRSGRVANGVPGKIKFDAVAQSDKTKLDVSVEMQTGLTFDLNKNLYQLNDLNLQVKGDALDINKLSLVASIDASADLSAQEFKFKNLLISATGIKGKDNFDAKVTLPAFSYAKDMLAVEKFTAKANLDGDVGKMIAVLSLKDLQGSLKSFKSGGLALDVDLKQPQQTFKLKMTTPLAGSLEDKQINLSDLVFAVTATGDKLPNKTVSSELKGSVKMDGVQESLQLKLTGGLLQSKVKANMNLKGFAAPDIRYDVDVDQFDADLYLPKKSAAAKTKAEPAQEQPFDLSALQKLNIDGKLRVGSLKVANVKSSRLRIDVKAKKGQVNISPLSANLYQGSINGSIAINATKATPSFAVKQNLKGVQLGSLIKDAVDFDMLEGKASVTLNLNTQGNTVSALKKGLNGNAALNMAGGAIKGIDLSKLVHGVQNLGQGVKTLKPVAGDKTEFNELKATFKVNNGVARNDDLLVKSKSLQVTGGGDIDIGNSSIDYSTKTTVADAVDAKKGSVTIPVQLVGPFADLKFKVDYGAVVADAVKQKINTKVEEKKEELKQQLQEKLKGGLQNLFK